MVCVCSLANRSVAYEDTQSNLVSDFRDFECSFFPILFFFYFYSTVAGVVPCDGREKSPRTSSSCRFVFDFLWDHQAHTGYFENQKLLKPALVCVRVCVGGGCVCSLANYSVAYEETQSNRVSNVRGFCVFVSKGNPF